jgi:hypothetical protein
MKQSFVLSLVVGFVVALGVTGCRGSKEMQRVQVAPPDTAPKVVQDTTTKVNDLDYVEINTDIRVNPVQLVRNNAISDGGMAMETVVDTLIGCSYPVPKEWLATRRGYRNLVNYSSPDNKIGVIVSVAYKTFDSTNIWAQVQEALSFGKNQMPREDQRHDSLYESKIGTEQSYAARYNFNNRQSNAMFFKYKGYQFNFFIDHTLNSLTGAEAQAINYMFANFRVLNEPRVEIQRAVGYNSLPAAPVEEKPVKGKKGKRTKGSSKSKKKK